ncbi:MAG TPA: hypothetical protein DCR81_07290 [Smithella sp.]|jgi:pimeloyl-ACP methyl ester carboxylesterase|nr:hypothetical protein [Smithella sp.]
MFKKIALAVAGIAILLIITLITLPSPVNPVAYNAPAKPAMTGVLTPNDLLQKAELLARGKVNSPGTPVLSAKKSICLVGSIMFILKAARIRLLAQALGITKVHLGGSSMGGFISMMYSSLYPDDVKSLWLIDPAGIWSAPPSELRDIIVKTGKNPLMAKNEDEFAGIFAFVMSDPPFIPRPILNVMAQERIRNYELEKRIFKEMVTASAEKYSTGLKAPALIVFGDKDRAINPATADILHKLIPRSEVIIMKGLGHLPMIEQPRQSADDYLKFRAGLDKAQ